MSVYRVTEIIGTSSTSWEDAAAEAIRTAAGTLRDLRVAEVVKQDIHLDESGAITYRTKLQLSFKYEPERVITDGYTRLPIWRISPTFPCPSIDSSLSRSNSGHCWRQRTSSIARCRQKDAQY